MTILRFLILIIVSTHFTPSLHAKELPAPKELGVESFSKSWLGQSYSINLAPNAKAIRIVRRKYFDGFSPRNYFQGLDRVENWPSKFVRDGKHHSYKEVIGQHGRIQFHDALGEDGIDTWLEFLPTQLPVDEFIRKQVAVRLPVDKSFKLFIYSYYSREAMTIEAKNGYIESVFWSDY